jgi:cobalt-zinc-cadmium efflux system membrane fusion protein
MIPDASRFRLGVATLLLAGLLPACRPREEGKAAEPAAAPDEVAFPAGSPKLAYLATDTARVRRERTVAVLPAQLVMNEDRTVRVASPVTGRIRTVEAQPGDRVVAGQPLARIVSSDLAQANADYARATAVLNQAVAALARANDLFEHHIVAQKDLEQARTDEAQARAEAERAKARMTLLGGSGSPGESEYVLRSAIAGEVVDRNANAGGEVRPDNPAPLFTVSSLDDLWLTGYVFERDLPSVRAGDRLIFTTEGAPGRRFEATVTYVSGQLDPQTRTALVRGRLANPDHLLKPQMFGEARLLAPVSGGIVVPTAAIVTQGSDRVVFVQVAAGRFRRRVVTVGIDDGDYATIEAGLNAGEVVVTRGAILLSAELAERR